MTFGNIRPGHILSFALLSVGFALGTPAWGAIDAIDNSLEDLLKVRIVSTPKFAENPDQIPSVVSILTADDIRLYGWRTLGDALRSLQGFTVTNDHTYAYGGVRGISQPGDYRPRMQTLIDGQSITENIFASAPVDSTFPLDIGLIERIEVIRGPSAAIYGGDAMFGVINVVTRSGSNVGTEASLRVGSGADRRLRLSWGGLVGGHDVLLSVSGFGAHGRTLSVDDVNGDGSRRNLHRVDGQEGGQLFAKIRGSDWHLSLIHAQREKIVPTASYDTIADDRGHIETDIYTLINLSKQWRLNTSNTLHQQFYLGDYRYDGTFPYDYSNTAIADPRVMDIDSAHGSWWGIENRLVNTAWSGQRITLGIEYKSNWRQNQLNLARGYGCVDSGTTTPCLDDRRRSTQISLTVQDEIQISDATLLTLGISHDRVDTQGQAASFWSPRIGLTHETQTVGLFKILYGTAFRVPTVYERYYTAPSFPHGNPALEPEKLSSLEIAWEKRFGPQSKLTATAYHFHIDRMITADKNLVAMNGSPVRAIGLEVEYEQRWNNGSHLRTGYGIQHATDETRHFDNSPRHMVKANIGLPTGLPHLMAGLEGQWISRRSADMGNQSLPPYLLTNLNLRYAPSGERWDVALGLYNLFDRRYADPVSSDQIMGVRRWQMPQFGRTVMLHTTLHF